MTAHGNGPLEITNRDRDLNAIKAGLKMIPVVGEAIVQMTFGRGEEARQRRLGETIREAHAKLKELGRESRIDDNEDLATFFAEAAQPTARATNEDKRQRFRDLLFNAMQIPQGDSAWEESMYCLALLQEIDTTGLYILATVHRAEREGRRVAIFRHAGAPRWIFIPGLQYDTSLNASQFEEMRYDMVLVDKGVKSLEKMGLLHSGTASVVGPQNSFGLSVLLLNDAAKLLVRWTIADF